MVLEDSLREVAAAFERRLDEIAIRMAERQRQEIDEVGDLEAPELWDAARRITRDSRRVQALHVAQGMTLPSACPQPDAEAAQLAARSGFSLPALFEMYRVGHAATWDGWLDALDELDVDEADRNTCIRSISRFVNTYQGRIVKFVAEEYERELERVQGNPDKQRVRLVRDLLDGLTDSADGLDYDLDLDHLSVIAWGPDAKTAVHELATVLHRQLLWAPAEDSLLLAWLGSKSPLDSAQQRALVDFPPPGNSWLAVGRPSFGLTGFRRSHREAGKAHAVAQRLPQPVTLYDEVVLEAFAMSDEQVAREFVDTALGDLNAPDRRSEQLRETLKAYFRASHNTASASAALGLHKHTVARHIHAVEERIGCPVNARRAELELALRLKRLLK